MNAIQEDCYGTRASGTDSLVYRVLQSPSYRTVEIVERFLDAALIVGDKSNLRWRAQNIVDRMALYPERGIPKNAFDLVCWSDLVITDAAIYSDAEGVRAKSRYKPKPRRFVTCIGCQRKFLAKRADNTTCSPRCRRRASRKDRVSHFVKMTLREAA